MLYFSAVRPQSTLAILKSLMELEVLNDLDPVSLKKVLWEDV